MKINCYNFLAKANLIGSKKSKTVFVLILLSVVSLTLILSFAFAVNGQLEAYKNDDWARRILIDPPLLNGENFAPLDEKILAEIEQIEYVQSVDMNNGMQYQFFNIINIEEENTKKPTSKELIVEARSLYKTQKKEVIAGKTLDESPVFSCIIPHLFYPFKGEDAYVENVTYENGEDYLGKVITIKPIGKYYETLYHKEDGSGGYVSDWLYLPALQYKLKVVGVYNASMAVCGGPDTILVSNETGVEIQNMALHALKNQGFIDAFQALQNNPEVHSYTILVDHYDHIAEVQKELERLHVYYLPHTEYTLPDSVQLLSAVFTGAGNFLTFAILVLAVVNLFLSVSGALADRKGEVGLLKAIGYKDRQVFFCFYLEHVKIALRAFVLGALLSGAAVLCINWINGSGPFQNRIYVIRWEDFWLLCLLSFAIAVLVPLLCQLFMLPRLVKIQPRQAMGQL